MDIYEFGDLSEDNILLQPVDEHDLSGIENEFELIKSSSDKSFALIAFKVESWNRDLSPWEAAPVFGSEGFAGKAEETLEEISKYCAERGKNYYIGGYSLAALFSLWAVFRTDIFIGAACASPSVWFPGFIEYMRTNEIKGKTVYLSLGDKEEKTRNPVMSKVGACIREAEEIIGSKGAKCILEWNKGNHFKDADIRTAKAFSWILRSI